MEKPKVQFKTIDEYLKQFPEEGKEKLQKLREFVNKLIPGVEEAISYQMPAFKLNGK
jgi:uncharacterized protein YdhG (YjbR/CyaY superfamily)